MNEKEFFLFQQALDASGKVAIGNFVMHDKEHVCAIAPYEKGLLLTTINYAYEIKNMETIHELDSKPKLSSIELKLAKQLIEQFSKKKFDLKKYKDTFEATLGTGNSRKQKKKTKNNRQKKEIDTN